MADSDLFDSFDEVFKNSSFPDLCNFASTSSTSSMANDLEEYQLLMNPVTGDFEPSIIDSISDDVFSAVDANSLTVDNDVNYVKRPTTSNSLDPQTHDVGAASGRLFTKCTNPAAYYDSEFVFGADFRDIMLLKFREESGWIAARKIIWSLINHSELPVEYGHVEFNDNWLKQNLKKKNYDLVNKLHFWRFTSREIYDKRYHLKKAKDFYQKNEKKAREKVLKIFKKQTGIKNAHHTEWSFFVPERLPAPYNTMNIDRIKFYRDKLYEIPEVMNNLHFEIKENQIPDSDSDTVEKHPKRRKMFK